MIKTIHSSVRGRVRFKIMELYRSEPLKEHLEWKLAENGDILGATANPLTATVLVHYNSGNTSETIAALIESILSEFDPEDAPRPEAPTSSCAPPDCVAKTAPPPGSSALQRTYKTLRSLYGTETQPQEPWHLTGSDNALDAWGASADRGLSEELARSNLKRYGANVLPESEGRSAFSVFVDQFKSLPVALLGVAAGLSVVTGGLADAIAIMSVVAINAVIGFVTEIEADRTIESLKKIGSPHALVIRDGNTREISVREVAPGDLLLLRPGVYVAADGRLIGARNLTIDESALTGESMPVLKSPAVLAGENIPLADRVNMVFMGTLVTGGQGLAVVTATGMYTELGQLQILVGETASPETPMEKQLSVMGDQLVFISSAVCGVVFLIGLARGNAFLYMLKMAISLAVAAVPEGLPAVASTTLALGVRRMRSQNVLIRRLTAVETLGSVQTICFDKTGTVTLNRMAVAGMLAGSRKIAPKGGKLLDRQTGVEIELAEDENLRKLIEVCVLCSETEISWTNGGYIFHGSATEIALVRMAGESGMDLIALRKSYPLLKTRYRTEDNNFMSTLHEIEGDGCLVAVKGNPLEVLAMCGHRMEDGRKTELTDSDRHAVELENEQMAGDALRVLGFAFAEGVPAEELDSGNGLTWLGLAGMADPTREGVKELIPVFHRAGINTVMVTGDQTSTAYAVAKELHLNREGESLEILDSTHLAEIEPDALRALAERVHVFARVSPANKLHIVRALQQAGLVVAMTGDGINDGPALKAADIGVALGMTGTDVAREVSDVVLEKDDLQTMIAAVAQGRTIYGNIRKSMRFLLSTNFSEIMVMFFASAAGAGFPLTAMQLLWINLISDIFPGLALALEPPEPDVLNRPPRDPKEPIVRGKDFKKITFESLVISGSALLSYIYGISRYGIGPRASTLAFQGLTVSQLLHAISCRSETHSIFDRDGLPPNRYLDLALGGSFLMQLCTLVVPGLRGLLGLAPFSLADGLIIGANAVVPLLVNESVKKISSEGAAAP